MTSLDQLHRSSTQAVLDDERREEARTARLATQQFLNHNAALVRVFLRHGNPSHELGQSGEFANKVLEAKSLAMAIAAEVNGVPIDQIPLDRAKFFRTEAANIIAQAWEEDIDLDTSYVVKEVGQAISNADGLYDGETIEWANITGSGSVAMTMASIALSLSHVVFKYNFRLGNQFVLSTLTSTVVTTVAQAVDVMCPEGSTIEDRRSLSQTTLQRYTAMLAQIYEDACREAIDIIQDMPTDEKKAWLQKNAPLASIIKIFRIWADDVAQVAAKYGRDAIAGINRHPAPTPSR